MLPTQVKKANDKADAILAAQDKTGTGTGVSTGTSPEEIAKEQAPVGKTVDTALKPDSALDDTEDYKQKYLVMKGKYDAEVPRLIKQVKELENPVADTDASLEPESVFDDISSGDGGNFAADYPDIAKYIDSKIQGVPDKISTIEKTVHRTATELYLDKLNAEVPKWEETVKDGDFSLWLQEYDPASGKTRYELAKEAEDSLDATRVAWFYKQYNKTKAPEKKSAEDFVTPPSGNSPHMKLPSGAPLKQFTKAEIANFYSAKARGKIEKSVADKIEAQINAFLNNRRE